MTWKATAFTSDREEGYSVAFQGDAVRIERAHGMITVEVTDAKRRANFVLPEKLFKDIAKLEGRAVTFKKPKEDDYDFG